LFSSFYTLIVGDLGPGQNSSGPGLTAAGEKFVVGARPSGFRAKSALVGSLQEMEGNQFFSRT